MASWREARRGKYSVGFKKRVVAEALAPGASVAEIARSHGLNANMIFGWRKDPRFQPPERKRKAIETALARASVETPGAAPVCEPAFLPVELAPEGAPSTRTEPISIEGPEPAASSRIGIERRDVMDFRDPPAPAGRIELVLANGHRLLLSGNVDADAVLRLARGLAAQDAAS